MTGADAAPFACLPFRKTGASPRMESRAEAAPAAGGGDRAARVPIELLNRYDRAKAFEDDVPRGGVAYAIAVPSEL
ncbi:hypothetical protein, partial [Chelatococcus composti]